MNRRSPQPPRRPTPGARTWLAVCRSGRRFAFVAADEQEAWRRAFTEAGGGDEVGLTIRPYLED